MNSQKQARAILAIDYGSKFTGLAIASAVKIAKPLKTLLSLSDDDLISELEKIIRENNIDLVLVGQPLNLKGQKSQQSSVSEQFAAKLKYAISQPVAMQPETDTSNWAKEVIGSDSAKLKLAKESGELDALAAAKILQDYLDEHGFAISA